MQRELRNDHWASLDYPQRRYFPPLSIPNGLKTFGFPDLGKIRLSLLEKLSSPLMLQVTRMAVILYILYYLVWRAVATLSPSAPVFSWILLIAEAFGLVNYVIFSWTTKNTQAGADFKPPPAGQSVDIYVPTYNENLDILEATLTGCNRIRYPHTTYLLDDGNRPEVDLLARRMGCEYIARENNQHAKAGNINHALSRTTGDFIVVIDADTVPQPEFIDRTLGYFEDERLAFVQTPQEFFNLDSIQHGGSKHSWHEQKLFYRVIQPGKNNINAAFWCGSPSILRRKALADVGGVAIDSITEDIHTSVRLHSRGWKSLFVNEVLAYGIAPETLNAFLKQRLRWAQGTMQLYRSKDSPIWIAGLTLKQRISYLGSFLAYFESYQKLIYLITPVIIVIFGIYPMSIEVNSFLVRWIPYFLLTLLANELGGRGYFRYFLTEKFNLLKMIIFIQASLMLFTKRELTFKVTPKTNDKNVYRDELRSVRSFLAIFGLVMVIIVMGVAKVFFFGTDWREGFSFLVALGWSTYNAALIFSSLITIIKKRHDRAEYRFPVNRPCQLITREQGWDIAKIQLDNISPKGAGLVMDENVELGGSHIVICLSTQQDEYLYLPINKVNYHKPILSGSKYVGISFGELTTDLRSRLLEYIFICLPEKECAAG
jgi:cellulose synthase (UDP-forming)